MESFLILILSSAGILIVAAVVDPEQKIIAQIRRPLELENNSKVKRHTDLKQIHGSKLKNRATSRDEDSFEEEERGEVCFGELGCFGDGYPFNYPREERLINLLPNTPDEIKTQFRFFAPKRNGMGQIVMNHNFSRWDLDDSGFNVGSKTKFIIHGYLGGDADWAKTLKQALILKEQCNVFIVDWSDGDGILYEQAVANVRVVGAEVGLFIKKLMNATRMSPLMVHIIGHSLGAHGAGYAGKFVQNNITNAKIGRITGLDPAGPYFNDVRPQVRLDAGDAKFVDVIHTNWAEHRLSGFGLLQPIGHFDFYPEGGEDQPGCPTATLSALEIAGKTLSCMNLPCIIYQATQEKPFEFLLESVNDVSCSHGRAYEYFIESIMDRNCSFRSLECFSYEGFLVGKCGNCRDNDCVSMGYYADRFSRFAKGEIHKKFYLRIYPFPPYCVEKTKYSYIAHA